MNYEKKYKEIVGQIKKAYLYAQTDSTKAVLEEIFPELAESNDEKIRKEILSFCKNRADNYPNDPKYANIGNWISWLEKQDDKIDFANKEYWRGYREGKKEILDKYAEIEKQGQVKESFISQQENRTCEENGNSLTSEDAIEREVKEDAGGYPYIDATELYDYENDKPLAKAGDRVKVVFIKDK